MRKLFLALCAAAAALTCVSCGAKKAGGSVSDYMGAIPNAIYEYEGEGNDYAAWSMFFDYMDEGRQVYQRRDITGGFTAGGVVSCSGGILKMTYFVEGMNFFADMTAFSPNYHAIILREPLELGAKWDRGYYEEGKKMRSEITAVDMEITVPYGSFKAIELTITFDEEGTVLKEYYARDLGLIKSETTTQDGLSFSSSLASIMKDTALERNVLFFYPAEDYSMAYEERVIKYETNADCAEIMLRELNAYGAYKSESLIGGGVKINGISFSPGAGRIKIDFSKELIEGKNYSKAEEAAVIEALVNTFGYCYGVKNVCLTVEGGGYASENFSYRADEYLAVSSPEELGLVSYDDLDDSWTE